MNTKQKFELLVDNFKDNPVGLKNAMDLIRTGGRDENDLLLSGALGIAFLFFVFGMGYLVRGSV